MTFENSRSFSASVSEDGAITVRDQANVLVLAVQFEVAGSRVPAGSLQRGNLTFTPQASQSPGGFVFTLSVSNSGDEDELLTGVGLRFDHALTGAFCGVTSYVAAEATGSWLAVVAQSGSYSPAEAEGLACEVVPLPIQGQRDLRLTWRATAVPEAPMLQHAVLPDWYPEPDVTPGEPIEIELADGVITALGVQVTESFPTTSLDAAPGVHSICLQDSRGRTDIRLGWRPNLPNLIDAALDWSPTPDVEASLRLARLRYSPATDEELDRLDVAIGEGVGRGPLGIAAAALAAQELGTSLLTDAGTCLASLLAQPTPPFGSYLAATQLYTAAVNLGHPAAAVVADSLTKAPSESLEARVVCQPARAHELLIELGRRVGWALPQQPKRFAPRAAPLIQLLRDGELLGDQTLVAEQLHRSVFDWSCCLASTPEDVAWLVWLLLR